MLAVDGLDVAYGPVRALRGVSLQVAEGEMVSVVGPNGAGKSTLLLAIAGALAPSAGEVRFKDQRITGRATENIARLGISLVPEGRNIFTQLTVEENLRLGTQMRKDRDRIEQDYAEMLSVFPILGERLSSPGGKLSSGEQQQLAIARALMTGARFILLDEPALGLAPIIVETVYSVLQRLRAERAITLLIVEQSTHRALENADRVYVLRQGRIELEGASRELDEKAVEQAYFGYA
jgi:branched-chain amino acid transport system ATP-binding protein